MGNWVDSVVSYFSPAMGAQRARARVLHGYYSQMEKRSYEGASTRRRMENWNTAGTSADAALKGSLDRLRARSHDLVRNDPHANSAVERIESEMIGVGIMGKLTHPKKDSQSILSAKALWQEWAETTACDADGLNTFGGLQGLITRTIVESGECLVRKRRIRVSDGPIPVQYQVLEPDYIDTLKEETLKDGGFILQGVEFDKQGRRVAYWLFPEHPGGLSILPKSFTSQRVPASEVHHLHRVLRPGQVRGVPWFAPILVKLKDHADFSDATLLRQKIANCFTAFVRDLENISTLPSASRDSTASPLGETMTPGQIEVLRPGEDITLANPPGPVTFSDFSRAQLQAIATGMGISYETLTGDYSQVNFSSARMGRIREYVNIEKWRWNLVIPRAIHPMFLGFLEGAQLIRDDVDELVGARWTPPKRELTDPTREVPAMLQSVRAGFQSLPDAIREHGFEPDEVFAEIAEANEQLDQLSLKLDSDPRNMSRAGVYQPPPQGDE